MKQQQGMKKEQLTTPQAIQQDLEAEVGFPYLEGWPTAASGIKRNGYRDYDKGRIAEN